MDGNAKVGEEKHHGRELLGVALGILAGWLGVRFGQYWAAWVGGIVLFIAIWGYSSGLVRRRKWVGYSVRGIFFLGILVVAVLVMPGDRVAPRRGRLPVGPSQSQNPVPAQDVRSNPIKESPREKEGVSQRQSGKDDVQTGPVIAGPCSTVQIGGTGNSAAANCGTPSRVLPGDKATQLKSDIALVPAVTTFIFPAGTSEDVQPVLVQLCDALASWRPNCQGLNGTSIGNLQLPLIDGIECHASSWGSGSPLALRAAFEKAGVHCSYIEGAFRANLQGGGTLQLGGIVIIIGSWSAQAAGAVSVLQNEGVIDQATIKRTTIRGAPPVNSKTVVVQNLPGSKMGKLDLEGTNIDFIPNVPIPALPEGAAKSPGQSYKILVTNLHDEINVWLGEKRRSEPDISAVGQLPDEERRDLLHRSDVYWKVQTKEFHERFGPRIELLASYLRGCHVPLVQQIYNREMSRFEEEGAVVTTLDDLDDLAMKLPDDNSRLHCDDAGSSLPQPDVMAEGIR
jgi:hypothetical protein